MSDLDEIVDLFRQEASEHLAALEKGFLDLETAEAAEARASIINSVFRHAHGLKGAARAVELIDIQNLAQKLEDTLDELRDNPDTVTTEAIGQGLAQFDDLREVFDRWLKSRDVPEATDATTPEGMPRRPLVDTAEDRFTVRVSSDRLDRMLSLAGELRISQRAAGLNTQQLRELSIADFRSAIEKQEIGNWQLAIKNLLAEMHKRQLREELLLEALEGDIHEARLLPASMLAESLRRAVRDLAQSLGKSIRYEVDVGTVLLDKAVIEALKDPLLHMVRNAAHHGIESPHGRRTAGKPEEGCIQLRATRRGDRVHIHICDDGGGIDFEHIRAHVRETSQLDESEIVELSHRELASHLFHAGFTTATQADEISGRGVGLDVVHDAVRRLHGSVELESSSPAGTTFVISVPVTISTVRILTVTSGGQYYGIPSSSIVRTARVRRDELRELEGGLILTVDEEPVPWVPLADFVGPVPNASQGTGRAMPYVLISHEGKRLAIGVDDTEDELEVILKPLGFPLTGMAGIVGGTIRPDGSVQIVLDVGGGTFRPQRTRRLPSVQRQEAAARILVVDDSPTTRTIVRNVLAAAGYSVRTATDGVDALERLRYQPFDLVVSDVQMPRMNGFELTRQVKSQFGLPVLLVTGMEKEEHRREGLAAGADAYVVKSTFEGEGLLEIVKQFV
jgi:two-component system chemotaxis sensor kinase CheA